MFRRVRSPWLWPKFLFSMLGPGKEHDQILEKMHSFTERVSLIEISFNAFLLFYHESPAYINCL